MLTLSLMEIGIEAEIQPTLEVPTGNWETGKLQGTQGERNEEVNKL